MLKKIKKKVKPAKLFEESQLSTSDYERLGRLLVSIGESGHINRKRLYRTAFLKGIATGLGGVIGATIVVTLVLYLLSLLGEIPFIGEAFESLRNTIDS